MMKKWYTILVVIGIVVFLVGYFIGSVLGRETYDLKRSNMIDIERRLYEK